MTRGPMLEPAVETMSRDELRSLQERLLRDQIERCAAGSALYASRLADAGAEPGDVRTLEDLARLPVLTKEELREDQRRQTPFGTFLVADAAELGELHPSTGTTGTPVNTVWSARDVETITSVTARTLWQFGVRPGDVIQNAFAYGLWVAGLSCHYAAGRLRCLVVPTGTATATQRQIEFLRSVRATVLLATPSYGLHIAEALREQGIDPDELALKLGCFGGERARRMPPRARSSSAASVSTRSTTTAGRSRPDVRVRMRSQGRHPLRRGLRGCRVPRPGDPKAGARGRARRARVHAPHARGDAGDSLLVERLRAADDEALRLRAHARPRPRWHHRPPRRPRRF